MFLLVACWMFFALAFIQILFALCVRLLMVVFIYAGSSGHEGQFARQWWGHVGHIPAFVLQSNSSHLHWRQNFGRYYGWRREEEEKICLQSCGAACTIQHQTVHCWVVQSFSSHSWMQPIRGAFFFAYCHAVDFCHACISGPPRAKKDRSQF